MAEVVLVELRCPENLGGLLAKVKLYDDYHVINSDNLLELSCRDCRKTMARLSDRTPTLVVHSFNVAGEFVNTEITYED